MSPKRLVYLIIFFATFCTLIDNNSTLPAFCSMTNYELNTIKFSEKHLDVIRAPNPNKAHGLDDASIHMIKTALHSGIYPNKWEKANVVPVHKKDSKHLLKSYRPISVLPICGKIFQNCIYNKLYSYFESSNIFSSCQSGLRKQDSCVSQLLVTTHNCFQDFDA